MSWFSYFKPPKKLTVSEWADRYRMLSSEASAESGKWDTSRAEYQREIMDAFSDPNIERVVLMSSSQIGKTEILLNIIGYYITYNPSPILLLQPTLEMAQAFSKDRLAPMIRDSKILSELLPDFKSRSSGNTILHKSFPGGHITMAGANSPASLASRPIKILLADEVDRYPISAGAEGDPLNLAVKRTTTFWDKKQMFVSTPTIKGKSRIELAYNESDQRKFYVPCPYCDHKQILLFQNVVWEDDKPDTARYKCEKCGSLWNDAERWRAIQKGEWIATKPSKKIAGFWLNELYSSWVKLEEIVENFLEAKKTKQTLKVFVNTTLGETWEDDEGFRLEYKDLMNRKEDYDKDVPDDVLILTAGIDTQDDRLEVEIVGWGKDYESWSIDFIVIHGDTSQNYVWNELAAILSKTYEGKKIMAACIDTGGHRTKQAYHFVSMHRGKNIFAIKGSNILNAPIVNPRPNRNNEYKIPLYMIGVNTAKDVIMSNLMIDEVGAGYCHFPNKPQYDEEYFKQLTAEKREDSGRWIKRRHRNEALDIRVYAYAALEIIGMKSGGIDWNKLKSFNEGGKIKRKKKIIQPIRSYLDEF